MKTTAAHPTPPTATSGTDATLRSTTVVVASNLVWQLAIVVLLPIFGGAQLDKLFDTKPVITVIGFAVAAVAMGFVVWRQMKALTPSDIDEKGADV